jgi:hypothetical protein
MTPSTNLLNRLERMVSAAILLAVTLCAGCASTDPSGDLRPASDWHLSDMHFGRWYQ